MKAYLNQMGRFSCSALLKFIVSMASWLSLVAPSLAIDSDQLVNVYLYWAKGCPHCEREIDFFAQLQKEHLGIHLHSFEVTTNSKHRATFIAVTEKLGIADPAVPLTIIGNQVWVGYANDALSGAEMRRRVQACLKTACPDAVAEILKDGTSDILTKPEYNLPRSPLPEKMQVPLLGEIALRDLTLPVLTIILGALDGFNPCAMWSLVFLIGLLLGMKDTMRMWALGSAFIVGSAAIYFVFMATWLNLFLILGSVLLIRVVIGLVALGGGFYYLREYFLNKGGFCPVTAPEKRQRAFQRLKSLAQERNFLVALFGILALAFLVNLVDLLCSAGIPAVYTQILTMHVLPTWQYYSYMLLYIVVFMADDLLVFFMAMLTLHVSGITTKYSRYSHLIGGVLMLVIGALMLLRPDLLMFG
jgi:hypothetical protein